MPRPRGPGRLDPGDLAKRIAERLAETAPAKRRFSLRDSVLVGRLISGVVILVTAAALVGMVFLGVDWLTGRSPAATPGPSIVEEGNDQPTQPGLPGLPGTTAPGPENGVTTTTIGVPFVTTVPSPGIGLPVLPTPTTTTTAPVTTSPQVTTTPSSPVTTKAPTTSSSTSTPTTSPTTATTTSTSTSTTTTVLTSTTTSEETTTTTTLASTTTVP